MRAYYDSSSVRELPDDETHVTRPTHFDNSSSVARRALVLAAVVFATLLSGCVYRAAISQGNLIKQDDLDQVEIGMTRNQVRFLLGTPMVDDPFHADRWDYVYYLKIGRQDAGFKRWVSIFFEDDKVVDIRKDQDLNPSL